MKRSKAQQQADLFSSVPAPPKLAAFQNRRDEVIELIQDKFLPIIRAHAISGQAHVNIETLVFDDPLAISMFIDIFSERGFHAVVDQHRIEIPETIVAGTGKVITRVKKVWRVSIRFEGSEIRRGGA